MVEPVFIANLLIGKILALRRQTIGFDDFLSQLLIIVHADTQIFHTIALGLSCEADVRDAALRILHAPEVQYHFLSFHFRQTHHVA